MRQGVLISLGIFAFIGGVSPLVLVFLSAESISLNVLLALNLVGWIVAALLFMSRLDLLNAVGRALKELGFTSDANDLEGKVDDFIAESARYYRAAFAFHFERTIAGSELSSSLNKIVNLARRELQAEAAELALCAKENGQFTQAFISGVPKTVASQGMLSDASSKDILTREKGGDRSVMLKEIRFAGTLFGILRVELPKGQKPTENDWRVLQLLSTQSAMLLIDSSFTEELLRMKRVSEESIQAKTGFLANLSHEIRGPLGVILNGIELTLEGLCGPVSDSQRETLGMIQDNGNHLLDLVNDVLDYARVEAGKVSAKPVELSAKELLKDLTTVVRSQAISKKHSLELKEVDEQIAVLCDKRHIRQMMINLLTNAIKYTPEGGKISVWAERIPGNKVKIFVQDTGVGIPESEQHCVFGAFERVNHKYSTAQVGTGLGMPLTKKLAEVNDGDVGFSSKEGEGSIFWIILPGLELKDDENDTPADKDGENINQVQGSGESILIVDSDADTLGMLERYLDHHGFEITCATTGKEVLKELKKEGLKLVILEDELPDIDAEDLIAAIRANPRSAELPLILLSSKAFVFDIERFLKLGADRCLSKPVDLQQVAITVRSLLDQSNSEQVDNTL